MLGVTDVIYSIWYFSVDIDGKIKVPFSYIHQLHQHSSLCSVGLCAYAELYLYIVVASQKICNSCKIKKKIGRIFWIIFYQFSLQERSSTHAKKCFYVPTPQRLSSAAPIHPKLWCNMK